MMKKTFHSSVLSICVVLAVLIERRGIASGTPIKILDTIVSTKWNTTKTGQSSIVVEYVLDGATLGTSTDGNDFYVLQSLQDGTHCNDDYIDGFASLNGLTEPAITGTAQTTTNLVSLVDWPRGINLLCLRFKLMLQMSNDNDLVWHQVDFKFDVDVSFEEGTSNVILGGDGTDNGGGGGGGIAGNLPITGDAADVVLMDDGPTYPGVDPTFSIFFVELGPFPYGAEIPFLIEFHHSQDIFTYTVPIENVIPVDASTNNPLTDADGKPITLRSVEFVMLSTDHATGIQGRLTITLPLIMFQMTSLSNVWIVIPVVWTNKSRRRTKNLLRRRGLEPIITERSSSNNDNGNDTSDNNTDTNNKTGDDTESSRNSWQTDAVIKLELVPYDQDSGAARGSNPPFDFLWIQVLVMMGLASSLLL